VEKKILLVGWGYPPEIDGGLDVHVKHLFENLQERGVDVELALPEERAPVDRENILGVETGEGDMVQRARKMSAEIPEIVEDFDVVHTHDWFGAEAGYKAKKYSNCSWISTIHSLSSDRGGGFGELEKLEEVAIEEPDRVLTVSGRLAGKIEEKFDIEPEVIRNGSSRPEKTGRKIKEELEIEGQDMVFFVGRHAEQKGVKNLLYGFKKFLDSGRKAVLVMGGDGHLKTSLEKFAEILDIEEKVVFEGFIPDSELGDYYAAADIFVSPSKSEPFGLTITEALEMGTKVVATDSGAEEILEKDSVVKIRPESDSIAEGIRRGLEKNSVPVKPERSWQDMAEEVLNVYRDL
jgi:glycosyltransferase involved in cell wall biosynthesis